MSHKAHEQLPTPPSCSIHSGASREGSKRWGTAAAAALLTLALGQVAQAADGQLDPSFGDDGRVIYDIDDTGGQHQLFGLAIQPDGRIVVGGSTRAPSNDLDFVVGAFRSVYGSLDTAFGTGGLTITDISGPQPAADFANALVLQTDGKIVLVGRSGRPGSPESPQFAAVRYTADGAVDTGFGVDGILETPVPGGDESIASDVAIQPDDGKIILAGVVGAQLDSNNRSGDIALVRYNRDGSLDDDGPLDKTPGDRFGVDGTGEDEPPQK
jgi:uncharacterized delta-60 repeat protein